MFLDSNGKRLFKKEKSIHEFAEEPEIKELIKLGFMKIDNSKYEYNDNCYCKVHSKNHKNDNLKEYDNKRKCCHDQCKSYATRFDEEFNYVVQSDKFNMAQYENNIVKNLNNKISNDIIFLLGTLKWLSKTLKLTKKDLINKIFF